MLLHRLSPLKLLIASNCGPMPSFSCCSNSKMNLVETFHTLMFFFFFFSTVALQQAITAKRMSSGFSLQKGAVLSLQVNKLVAFRDSFFNDLCICTMCLKLLSSRVFLAVQISCAGKLLQCEIQGKACSQLIKGSCIQNVVPASWT